MPRVKITPVTDIPVPYDIDDQSPDTFMEEVEVAGNTADLLVDLGVPLEVTPATAAQEQKLIDDVVKKHDTAPLARVNTAYAASAFLRTYGQQMAFDAAQARVAITAKLMEIADCGDTKYELKALELLGKHSDIGLFTERSELTIKYSDPKELEEAIKERVKRLLNADIIDVTPGAVDLDSELGIADPWGDEIAEVAAANATPELDDLLGELDDE